MKTLSKVYKSYLEKIANEVQRISLSTIKDPKLVILPPVVYESDTYGWYIDIFKLKKIPGRLQIWIDLFPNIDRPIVSLCYNSGNYEQIVKVAKAFNHKFNYKPNITRKNLGPKNGGRSILSEPLPKKLFNIPIIESYWTNFFTVFFDYKINLNINYPSTLINSVSKYSIRLLRAMSSTLEGDKNTDKVYAAFENRTKVSRHLSRERSQKLVKAVKTRDGFTCQICGFNFTEVYGEIGRGFSEVHHIVPLSKLKREKLTRIEDLITVCSNCHRMLHKMEGIPDDVKRLKKMVKKHNVG